MRALSGSGPLWTFRPTPGNGRSTRRPRRRPRAIACTLCASACRASSTPDATSAANDSVADTCHSTATSVSGMPPCPSAASGSRASRVHSTTLVESGSPEATPRWNGYFPPVRARGRGADTAAAATARPPSTIVRRSRSPITCTVRRAPEQRSRMRDDHAGKLVHPELINVGVLSAYVGTE